MGPTPSSGIELAATTASVAVANSAAQGVAMLGGEGIGVALIVGCTANVVAVTVVLGLVAPLV